MWSRELAAINQSSIKDINMKWILFPLILALAFNAHAARFKTESGKYIMKGDNVSQLVMHAGEPFRKRYEVVCVQKKRDLCLNWQNAEYWYFKDPSQRIFWVLTIMRDRITNMEWHRSR
jgi:hypothetical protein